ncbi:Ferritin-like domain-containing protein [Sporobacter termitidis DSM 10068]|uniref:Ferritin-like domain-containing protein n=1 Tax=Sporobacter termitidis DSM 10068 TaxID=1123282 RepID=A0A1M5WXS5_9FIRM|nr:ferritin-like domain-containing protein [Sporobacter termitidis]SHH91964.1 Ferritin-like domain-containing protein [Sporobacter termitidis DSM 10068]
MERDNDQFDRAKFDAVWRRVMPEMADAVPEQKPAVKRTEPDENERLRAFMDDESCDAQLYCLLANKCSGNARQTLMRISCDERHHLKKLRAKYFIRTGETYTPPSTCPLICAVPDALRRKYSDEKAGAAAYRAAAGATPDADLKDTYLALSEDEARHAGIIGCLIENMF